MTQINQQISGWSLNNLMVDSTSTNVHWVPGFGHEVTALSMPTTTPGCPMLQCFRDATAAGGSFLMTHKLVEHGLNGWNFLGVKSYNYGCASMAWMRLEAIGVKGLVANFVTWSSSWNSKNNHVQNGMVSFIHPLFWRCFDGSSRISHTKHTKRLLGWVIYLTLPLQ